MTRCRSLQRSRFTPWPMALMATVACLNTRMFAQDSPVGMLLVDRSQQVPANWNRRDDSALRLIARADSEGKSPRIRTVDSATFLSGVELHDASVFEIGGASIQGGLDLNDGSRASLLGDGAIDQLRVHDASHLEANTLGTDPPWRIGSLLADDDATLVLQQGEVDYLLLEGRSTAKLRDVRIGSFYSEHGGDLAIHGGALGQFHADGPAQLALHDVDLGDSASFEFTAGTNLTGTARTTGPGLTRVSFPGDFEFGLEVVIGHEPEWHGELADVSLEMTSPGWLQLNAASGVDVALPYYGVVSAEVGPWQGSLGTSSASSLFDNIDRAGFVRRRPKALLRLPNAELRVREGSVRGTLADGSDVSLRFGRSPLGSGVLMSTSPDAFEEFRPHVFYNPENGHYYEPGIASFTWEEARDAAAERSYGGVQGHLVTITTDSEQAFINETFEGLGGAGCCGAWIGASDAEVEGEWRWMVGPEAGELFWLGDEEGEAVAYENWGPAGEPNGGVTENHIAWNWHGTLEWNDYHGPLDAYLIEYEPVPGDANGDGVADLADFAALRAHFGDHADRAHGDLNADLFVDLADFSLLKAGLGEHVVPEPSTLALAALAATAFACLARRRP